MFQRILQWIREVINKMIGQSSVKSALHVDIAISGMMAEALQLWTLLYQNQAHWLNQDIVSLGLPATISGEIARAVTIEMKVTIDGSPRADFLKAQFDRVVPQLRTMVEYGAAKGGLIFKPYIQGKQIAVDFVQADQFYPVMFDANGKITAVVFADQRTVGDTFYTRLEYHTMTPAGCEITNLAFKSKAKSSLGTQVELSAIDDWADLLPQALITKIDRLLIGYFKMPGANTIDPTSPLGVSCFSRAINLIEDADKQWSDIIWEMDSGQRAMYVDVLAFGKDKDGHAILPNKRLYRSMEMAGDVGSAQKMFEDWTPTIRITEYLTGLDAILRRIEFTIGLAYGTLSNPATVDKTATELKISQQRSYATITDTQKSLQDALEDLLWAMDVWVTIGNLAPRGTYQTAYDWDDSVIVDKDAQFQQDMRLVTARLMSPVEFRMRNFGETKEQAAEMLAMVAPPEPTFPTGA